MVSFAAISDIHCNNLEQILKGIKADILLMCGDLTFRGTAQELHKFENGLMRIRDKFKDIAWIGGNHDFGLQDWPQLGREIATRTNTHYLCDSLVTLQGIRIYGSPWTPDFGSWAFMYPRPTTRWMHKPPADVLITHGPPWGILDRVPIDGSVGCRDLRNAVLKHNPKPKVVCFGHIHEGRGETEIDGIKFYNCSVVDRKYNQVHKPFLFEL